MFYAKDLVGIEIFSSEDDKIKEEYLETVDNVGNDLMKILESLYNENFHYQLVIEGSIEEHIYQVLEQRQDFTLKLFEQKETMYGW